MKEIELLRHKRPRDFLKLFKKNSSKIKLNVFFFYFLSSMQQDLATLHDEKTEESILNDDTYSQTIAIMKNNGKIN